MPYKATLTPTMRLTLQAVTASSSAMSIANLSEATYASPYSIKMITQRMVKRGLLSRLTVSGMSYFTLPQSIQIFKLVR